MVVECPACERRLRVKESTRARKGRCPCGAIIILASSVDPKRSKRRSRALLVLFMVALAGGGLYWFFGSSPSTFEVTLTVREPAGVDRIAEPVTSGVPLPEGAVFDTSELVLLDKATQKAIPCQFTVLSRWPVEDPRNVGARWTAEAIKKRMEEKKEAAEKEAKAAKRNGKVKETARPVKRRKRTRSSEASNGSFSTSSPT
jgi:hypothetical protein